MSEDKEFIVELTEERSAFVKVVADNEMRAEQYAHEAYNDGTIPPLAFSQRNHYAARIVTPKDLEDDYGLEPEDAVSCSLVDMYPKKERLAKELFNILQDMRETADHSDVVESARAAVEAFAAGGFWNWDETPGLDRTTTSNYHSKLDEKMKFKPDMGM
jgi:hypothetical protein